ncbi:MAG TPA: hypothetical protein VGE74_29695 [Gemmata sp.]
MIRTPDSGYIASILAANESPCVSIYLPTNRGTGAEALAPVGFRNLAHRAEELLGPAPGAAAGHIVEQLHKLEADKGFWGHALDGVVVLASAQRFDAFTLPRTVPERVEVGSTFHVKPLLRYVQSAEPFHVLCVSRERVALFRGNRYVLTPLTVPGVQLTLAPPAATARAQPAEPNGHAPGHGKISHPDAERFFREVDRQIAHRVSEPSGLPLILAGMEENLVEFRALSKNRFITPDAVHGDWTNWSLHEIREAAWRAFEKHYLARLARIREDFGTATARGKGSGDLSDAARAAVAGRIGVLLIDADRTVHGSVDLDTGALNPSAEVGAGDMLDDLAELALKKQVMVIVTPSDQMPTTTGLAAIYRY